MGRGKRGGRNGRARACVLCCLTVPLLIAAVANPLGAQEARPSDRTIADAGREGRALLRELQARSAARGATGASALAPSDPVLREAARMRADIRRPRENPPARSGSATRSGVRPMGGICRGCGV